MIRIIGKITTKLRTIIVLSLLVAMLSVVLPASVSAASQEWYFTTIWAGISAKDDTIHTTNRLMTIDRHNAFFPGMGCAGEVKFFSTVLELTAWWYSDETASSDVLFGEHPWEVELYYKNEHTWPGGGTLFAEVWAVGPNGSLDSINGLMAQGSTHIGKTGTNIQKLTLQIEDNPNSTQNVPVGHRLGLRLRFEPTEHPDVVTVKYGVELYPSLLRSSSAAPTFPAPEVPVLALLSLGLTATGVLTLINRKKRIPLAS